MRGPASQGEFWTETLDPRLRPIDGVEESAGQFHMQIQGPTGFQTLQFTFSSDAQRQALLSRLTPGQILEARVLEELASGRFAIRFMGHTLVAESRLALLPGARVEARVDALGPPLVLSLLGRPGGEAAALSAAFRHLGLPEDAMNRAIVRGLIAHGQGVDRSGVLGLRDLLSGLSIDTADAEALDAAIARALFLRDQGIPVTAGTLAAYLSHLPPGALGGLLQHMADLLRAFRSPGHADRDLKALVERLQAAIPEIKSLDGPALAEALRMLGVGLEGRLAGWISAGRSGVPEGIQGNLKTAVVNLLSTLESVDSGDLDAGGRSALEALLAGLREARQALDTLQATNLPTPNREALQLQIPLVMEGTFRTADLRIATQNSDQGSTADPENVTLTLALELSALGPIRIELSVRRNRAACRVYAVDAEGTAFLAGAEDELREGLARCGYAVSEVAFRKRDQPPDPPSIGPPTVGVDFKA